VVAPCRCVGWHLARTIETSLPLATLDQALACRQPAPGLIHHSDRGVQYASAAYVERLTTAEIRISMSAVGNPYDTANAERVFTTLKREEVYLNQDDSFADADATLGHFIDEVDTTKRLHSSLGYRPPIEFDHERSS
jgi:putative transposase